MSTEPDPFEELGLIQARLIAANKGPSRLWDGGTKARSRAVLLVGPRGVGKTSFLLRLAAKSGGTYLSLDHPSLATGSLHEWVERLLRKGITNVYLDEVHAAKAWSSDLKALYDSWPSARIWASGSNSLLLDKGLADLSRRFLALSMPFLSFREYLVLRGLPDFGVHDPFASDTGWAGGILDSIPVLRHFEAYLRHGFRPFFLEGEEGYATKLIQAAQKTIATDILDLVATLNQNQARFMNAVLGYLSQSPIPVLQVNSLCREWNLGKEKLYSLLAAMEQTGLLRIVRHASDHSAMSVGAKIFLADPSMYPALSGKEGNLREAFVACAMELGGHRIHASKDETKADFIIDEGFEIEVALPGKDRKGAAFVVRDGADWPAPGIVPMWMIGFGW